MRSGRRPVPEGGRSLPVTLTTTPLTATRRQVTAGDAGHRRLLRRRGVRTPPGDVNYRRLLKRRGVGTPPPATQTTNASPLLYSLHT